MKDTTGLPPIQRVHILSAIERWEASKGNTLAYFAFSVIAWPFLVMSKGIHLGTIAFVAWKVFQWWGGLE